MKNTNNKKTPAAKPQADITSAKDKELKNDRHENEAEHDHEHGGIFGKNTELMLVAAVGTTFLGQSISLLGDAFGGPDFTFLSVWEGPVCHYLGYSFNTTGYRLYIV
jgi:hypothetical protein